MLVSQTPRDWTLHAGDPTLIGWLVTIIYFTAAALALSAMLRARGWALADERRFWLVLAGILFFLGLNKQLDLQTFLTQIARDLARAEGWYRQRRPIQAVFLLVVTIAGGAALFYLLRRFRRSHRSVKLAGAGLVLIALYVLTRAASFHHVDALLGLRLGEVRLGWILELSGAILTAWAAATYSVSKRINR